MTVQASIFAVLFSTAGRAAFAQQPEPPAAGVITLPEAVDLALAHNHAVRLARLSVDEKDRAKDVAKSAYFPQVRNETSAGPPDGYTVGRNSRRRARRRRCHARFRRSR